MYDDNNKCPFSPPYPETPNQGKKTSIAKKDIRNYTYNHRTYNTNTFAKIVIINETKLVLVIRTIKRFNNTPLNQEGGRHPQHRPAEHDLRRTTAGVKKMQHLHHLQTQRITAGTKLQRPRRTVRQEAGPNVDYGKHKIKNRHSCYSVPALDLADFKHREDREDHDRKPKKPWVFRHKVTDMESTVRTLHKSNFNRYAEPSFNQLQ